MKPKRIAQAIDLDTLVLNYRPSGRIPRASRDSVATHPHRGRLTMGDAARVFACARTLSGLGGES